MTHYMNHFNYEHGGFNTETARDTCLSSIQVWHKDAVAENSGDLFRIYLPHMNCYFWPSSRTDFETHGLA